MRPAVVLSRREFNQAGQTMLAMITSARHSHVRGDIPVPAGTAGLTSHSIIRMKVFTLDNRLIRARKGVLPPEIGATLARQLQEILRLG